MGFPASAVNPSFWANNTEYDIRSVRLRKMQRRHHYLVSHWGASSSMAGDPSGDNSMKSSTILITFLGITLRKVL